MMMPGERSLSYVIGQYPAHYHAERNHQDLANQCLALAPGLGSRSGQVGRRDRFGGSLSYYYRDVALLFNHTMAWRSSLSPNRLPCYPSYCDQVRHGRRRRPAV
jgi:hypothetical protein